MFQEESGGPLAGALIRAVGVYPPGDFVRLKNGDAAVVVQRAGSGNSPGNSPLVASVQGPNGKPIPGAVRRDTALAEFAIIGPLTDRKGLPRVLPEQVFGLIDA